MMARTSISHGRDQENDTGTCLLRSSGLAVFALAAGALVLAGCGNGSVADKGPSGGALTSTEGSPAATQPGPRMFATPEDAAAALKEAAQTGNRRELADIFGPGGRQLVFSGDRVQEAHDMRTFANILTEYLRVDHPSADRAVLYVGQENWPFPIPLVKGADGWSFDTDAGKEELLNRRIGENELNAIAVCRAYVTAQKEYASKDRNGDQITQYAQHFMSTPGKKDGLYWTAAEGEELSPMGPLVAEARLEGYAKNPSPDHPRPYKGYFFHILTAQGPAAPGGEMNYLVDGRLVRGFALVACPSKWGASGIMTFIVNQDGKIYQKNLGKDSRQLVSQMTQYNPDATWELVKDQAP